MNATAAPQYEIRVGDCLAELRALERGAADVLITDPPAGIAFMGKEWDGDRGGRAAWIAWLAERLAAARAVLPPGAPGLVWALPRTSHWTGMAIEDAGFRIVDRVAHIFGTGWPKSPNLLKPAVEDWWLVQNPGAPLDLDIDACRVPIGEGEDHYLRPRNNRTMGYGGNIEVFTTQGTHAGRWPAHLALSHDPACNGACAPGCPVALFEELAPNAGAASPVRGDEPSASTKHAYKSRARVPGAFYADAGSAARFFPTFAAEPLLTYQAKAAPADKTNGGRVPNDHPTVKSTPLMQWLIRLITPAGGVVLDPFCGSGSTGKAAVREGRRFLGIEESPSSAMVAYRRIADEVHHGETISRADARRA